MKMNKTNPKVDSYIKRSKPWQEEIKKLREIILDRGLTEELKWGSPCYTDDGRNIVLIHVFKEYCAILFFQGALLKDAKGILATPGQHQAARQIRFANAEEIDKLRRVVTAYIDEAIRVEKAGLKVELKKTADFAVPEEFQNKLAETPALKAAFETLTPGRQRAYLHFFSGAKQSTTREARVQKCLPQILAGKGLND